MGAHTVEWFIERGESCTQTEEKGRIVIGAFRSVFGAKWNAWVPLWMAFSGIGLVSGRVSPRPSIIYTQFYDYISRV
jgi:hypothetical protein